MSVDEIKNVKNPKNKYLEQQIFSVVGGKMQKKYIYNKNKIFTN